MGLSVGDVELVDWGVDWITVSQMRSGSKKPLELLALPLLKQQQKLGNMRHGWGMAGYSGFQCGSVQVGTGPQGALVRLGSKVAQQHWRKFYDNADGCSRLDLQLTVKTTTPTQRLIRRHYRQALRKVKSGGPTREISIWQSSNGSATLYINQRISDRFGRIYDKGAESKQPEWKDCVRYEIELKNDYCSNTITQLHRTKADEGPITVSLDGRLCAQTENSTSLFIISRALQFFSDVGASVPRFAPLPINNIVSCDRSDSSRVLQWLSSQVRPTLARMSSSPHWPDVLKALALHVGPSGTIEYNPKQM